MQYSPASELRDLKQKRGKIRSFQILVACQAQARVKVDHGRRGSWLAGWLAGWPTDGLTD